MQASAASRAALRREDLEKTCDVFKASQV